MTTVQENENALREQLFAVPDAYERLNYLVGRAGRETALSEDECSEKNLVAGCVSQVWIVPEEIEGGWAFRSDSDAPMVKAVAMVYCSVYSGGTGEEIANHEATILEDTGVLACLTQSRRAGAQRILERIRGSVG